MLDIYIEQLTLNPYTFYGINYVEDLYRTNKVWTQEQRLRVEQAMQITKMEMEKGLGYHILPTYHSSEPHILGYGSFRINQGYLIVLGSQIKEDLNSVIIDYETEPATVEVITDVPDTIRLYRPGVNVEISVTNREYVDGTLTLSVPRYNLLKSYNNPILGWNYLNLDNFLEEVEVKSVTINENGSTLDNIPLLIDDARSGLIRIDTTKCVAQPHSKVYVNYTSGLTEIDYLLRSVWIGYAHAKMDIQPHEDGSIKLAWLWAKDIPKSMSEPQQDCPWGQMAGAYNAWRYVNLNRLHRTTPL